nr:hypothetical protein GCM10020092_097950 [Actinoplanes digitatis]
MPDGDYTATVTLGKAYRDYFKIAADSATQTVNVKVETIDEGQGARSAKAPESFKAKAKAARAGDDPNQAAAVAEHSEHAGQGDESRQISAYKPEFRPPTKKPKAVKAASIPKGPRPDLRSLPAWGISLSQEEDGKSYVNFGATVWNGGTSPLLVDGFRQTGTELMDAYQYFFDAKGKEVGSVAAGTMEWDAREGHRHWHFTDFAQYNLLSSDKKQAVRSGKEAFCLVNTDAVDYTVPNAKWRPENTDLSSSCGQNTAVAVREVLDIGNGDTYSQQRPGQSFEITDLPNGTYYIEVKANPVNRLSEVSTTNNTSLRKIVLGGTPTERTLEVPPRSTASRADAAPAGRGASRDRPGQDRGRARSRAYRDHHCPAGGAPLPQAPSDSPGRLTHRNASASGTPVRVVGSSPSARPGGLHQCRSPAPFCAGPLPLRLVSTTKCAPRSNVDSRLPYVMLSAVVSKLATFSENPYARSRPDLRRAATSRARLGDPGRVARVEVDQHARRRPQRLDSLGQQRVALFGVVLAQAALHRLRDRVGLQHDQRRVPAQGARQRPYPGPVVRGVGRAARRVAGAVAAGDVVKGEHRQLARRGRGRDQALCPL